MVIQLLRSLVVLTGLLCCIEGWGVGDWWSIGTRVQEVRADGSERVSIVVKELLIEVGIEHALDPYIKVEV